MMTLTEFNQKYQYKIDKNYDDWSVIEPNSEDEYLGDCESYILSLQKYVKGCKNLKPYFCYIGDIGHCIGVRGNKWIDCNTKSWRELGDFPESYNKIRKISLPELWLRKLLGFIQSLWYKEN